MATIQRYIEYRAVPHESEAVGYVVNAIVWDGVTPFMPGDGLALAPDPDGKYPIGSTYAAS